MPYLDIKGGLFEPAVHGQPLVGLPRNAVSIPKRASC